MEEIFYIVQFDEYGAVVETWKREDLRSALVVFQYLLEDIPDGDIRLTRTFD